MFSRPRNVGFGPFVVWAAFESPRQGDRPFPIPHREHSGACQCLRLLFAWIMIWAAAVVVLRIAWQVDQKLLLWGLLGFAPAVAAGVFLAWRRPPRHAPLRAALDRHGRLGGLLMAAGDGDIGRWSGQIWPACPCRP